MSLLFVLIPLIGAILVLSGVKARLAALITSGATLFFALGSLFCWDSEVWSLSLQVLSTPNIHLALGFADGISVAMVL
ncbi:MAG: hypothetical protein ABF334_10645, partial [Akkermansiaceae bacterium]